MTQDLPSEFSQVDAAADPASFVRLLGMSADLFAPSKARTFALLGPLEGRSVLDVGCGLGDDARHLARLAGPHGSVVGIDSSATMIQTATDRGSGGAEAAPLKFEVADAHQLPFPNGCFDACRANHVFMHLERPETALAEMVRVARPGGRLVLCEPDLETWIVAPGDGSVTRRIMDHRSDSFRFGRAGRHLAGMFHGCGLRGVAVEGAVIVLTDYAFTEQRFGLRGAAERAAVAGTISAEEVVLWCAALEEAGRAGHFFASFTLFTVSGVKG
jgi:SAM-dependent methyltransferase